MQKGFWFLILSLVSISTVYADDATYRVVLKDVPMSIELDGVVEAINQGTVAAQTSGRVIGVYVDVNDVVKKDAVLMEISATQQTASLDAAMAQLTAAVARNRDAQSQVQRYRLLFPQGAISKQQMDSAEANARSAAASVKAAQAAVEKAKDALDYTSVRAPYSGVVTERHVELGETISPGMPLLSGYGLEELRVQTHVPQKYHDKVSNKDQFSILFGNNMAVKPIDYRLFNYADPKSHTFTMRLDLPKNMAEVSHTELLPGMWVKTRFIYGERQALMIPKSAVIRRGELSAVFRKDGDKLVLNPIRVGVEVGDTVEVLSGLEVNDDVVLNAYRL